MRDRIHAAAQSLVVAIILVAFASIAQCQTYKYSMLYSFKNNGTDPTQPEAALIVDSAGNLYGTSNTGGKFNLGTVFKLTPAGKLTVLHSFQGGPADGESPEASLTRDSAGNLYGSTAYGGANNSGVVFKLTSSGQETILFSAFDGFFGVNGAQPNSVVRDSAGNIYGTAVTGGIYGGGTVFKLDTADNFTVLHNFCSAVQPECTDATQTPLSLITAGGNFYGPTQGGYGEGYGTLYEISPSGVLTLLHTFGGSGDRYYPSSSLRQDAKGNLYGVTNLGGVNDPTGSANGGILFKQAEAGGPETILYNFGSLPNCADGCYPLGPIAIDKTGNIFGIAATGANSNLPMAVWEVNTAGKETILHTFGNNVYVYGGLIIDSAGNLYGVTDTGGSANLGGVYKLTLQK